MQSEHAQNPPDVLGNVAPYGRAVQHGHTSRAHAGRSPLDQVAQLPREVEVDTAGSAHRTPAPVQGIAGSASPEYMKIIAH